MYRKSVSVLLLGAAVVAYGCQKKEAAAPVATASPSGATVSEDEKAVAALGSAMGEQAAQQLKALSLTPAEMEVFKKALSASLAGEKAQYEIQQYGQLLQARAQKQAAVLAAGEREKSTAFLANAAKEPGAVKTASGLVYKTVKPGTGRNPRPTDVVQVNYRGTLTDGTTEFDASAKHCGPAQFPLNRVIPCWTEGVGRMKVGEQARLVCPPDIAYGDRGQPPTIPPGATLVFEVELLAIQPPQAVQAPPGR